MSEQEILRAGEQAPDFRLSVPQGEIHLGEWTAVGKVLLVFYQEDGTPACTSALEGFREEHELIGELGAKVLGISRDGLESHRVFSDRAGGFPFPLASDEDMAVGAAYGVADPESGRHRRAVFVIDRGGAILHADSHFQPGSVPAMTAIFEALGLEF